MMRQLRFIFIVLFSFIFVTSAVFLRRTVSVLLCGVLSFNSASCYSFLNIYGKADAAAPPSSAVVTSKNFSFVEKDKQKVAGCLFGGVCVNLPQVPGVTGRDPIKIAKTAIAKKIGEAVGVGSPLLLDQKTAYPDVSNQVKDFHPQKLTITSAEDLQKPLSPGDYSIDVIAYCTQFSIHAPGQGLPYKLASLKGKQAPAISALLSRGTLQGIAPATLNANAWRIQAGLPLKQWPSQDQALIHKLIPEYEKGLEGDYLQQIENTYNQYHLVPGIPSFDDMLRQSGAPGQLVLQLRQARQALADQTISAERLPDMLYEPTGDGLPRVLPAAKDSSPSPWAEVKPGIFGRFTVVEGNLGKNLFEFRVTPKASAAINNSTMVATKDWDKNLEVSKVATNVPTLGGLIGADGSTGLIGYSIGRPSQALISAIPGNGKSPYKLTIYVVGVDYFPGTHIAEPGGHAWISLSDGNTTNYYSFTPLKFSQVIYTPIGVAGILRDAKGRKYDVIKEYIISKEGFNSARQAIIDWNDIYNLEIHNCATFAVTIGIAARVLSEDIGLSIKNNPASLGKYLQDH